MAEPGQDEPTGGAPAQEPGADAGGVDSLVDQLAAGQQPQEPPATPEPGGQPPAAAEPGQQPPAGGQPPAQEPPAGEPIEAPANWSLADRQMFAKAPREMQEWALNTHRAMAAAHTRRSQEIAPWRDMGQRWEPYFQQLGVTGPIAVNKLLETEYGLRTGTNAQKLEILRQLVTDYGIAAPDGGGEGQAAGEGGQPPAQLQDPRVDALAQQFQEYMAGQHQQHQAAMHGQQQQLSAQVQAFAQEVGADGKLAHPHFGEVRITMAQLAEAARRKGEQPTLKALYEDALWLHPSTRSELLAAEKRSEAERLTAEAQKAQQAGGQLAGGGPGSQEQPKDLDSIIEAAAREQAQRAA